MSEKIRLRVPSKPAADEVSHGNFSAKLTPKAVIEVGNRKFADWLVIEYGCAEVGEEDVRRETGDRETEESAEEDQNSSGNKNGGKR